MVLFLHALRICAIASVSVTIRGYVLITADVEDFKNLASTFLSPALADKLTALVAESGQDDKKQQADKKVLVPFSEIGNIVKDELFNSYKTVFDISSEKGTDSPTSYKKRYKTVKNLGNKEKQSIKHNILRQPDNEQTELEPLYIKEELKNPLEKRIDDYSHQDDNKKLDHAELRINERNKIHSQDATNPTGLFDEITDPNVKFMGDMFKKLDYTETKLGEWKYNPKTSQEPVNIKNVKSGYVYYLGENNEDTQMDIQGPVFEEDNMFTESFIDVNKIKTTELVTEKNLMNDKLIIGSKAIENDNIHSEPLRVKNHGTYSQYFLEPEGEEKESQEKKPVVLSVEDTNKYKTRQKQFKNKENIVKKDREKQVMGHDNFNQHFLGYKHQKIPEEKSTALPKQYNDMYETQTLESENQVSGESKNEVQVQVNEQKHKIINQHILASKQKGINDEKRKKSIQMYETNMSVRNKNKSSKTKKVQDENEKEFYNLEPSIVDKEEKKKPQKQLIEENDMYDKYALNYKTEDSYERKGSHEDVVASDKKLEIEKEFSHKSAADKHKGYKSNSDEKSLKNEKQRFNLKASKLKENSKTDQSIKTLTKVLPENLDDSLSDEGEVKSEDIKAKTEFLVDYVEITSTTKDVKAMTENLPDDSVEVKGKSTKRFIMKGTEIPKRDFYKMSSPDYYHKLPKVVEKYDFDEPIPEKDRERIKEKYVKKEPDALINKKIRLS